MTQQLSPGWKIEKQKAGTIVVRSPDGSACAICKDEQFPRVIPSVILYELCEELLKDINLPTEEQIAFAVKLAGLPENITLDGGAVYNILPGVIRAVNYLFNKTEVS